MKAKRTKRHPRHERLAEVDEVAIRLRVESLQQGGYVATSPDLPGLVAEGRSVTEAVEIAQGLGRKLLESCIEHGDPLPAAFAKARQEPREFIVPVGIS
jgi:antitoxin HicB